MMIQIKTHRGAAVYHRTVTATSLTNLIPKVDPSAFARISYTNHNAHPRASTWYPVLALEELQTDWRFVA